MARRRCRRRERSRGAARGALRPLARRTFLGVQVPEGPYAREVVFIYRLVDGRIAERWAVRDLGMMRQLGALQFE